MGAMLQLLLLLTIGGCSVFGQSLPFEVNNPRVKTCTTGLSLDTGSLTGIGRGDEGAPCTGYVLFNDGTGARRFCADADNDLTDYVAQRACYTMGINFYRDSSSATFSADNTRQMMLYRCFEYEEQNVDSPDDADGENVFLQEGQALSAQLEQGCTDDQADSTVYGCFDDCYLTQFPPEPITADGACEDHDPFFAIGCVDVNECVSGVYDHCTGPFETSCTIRKACGNNTDCTNHAGSFECSCKEGYKYSHGQSLDAYLLDAGCIDIDECQKSMCDDNALCINTKGSYLCLCEPGYTGDGHLCTKPDECEESLCDENAECTYVYSYHCTCKEGYTGDGYTCDKVSCKPLPTLPNGAWLYYGYRNFMFGDTTEFKCSDGYKVTAVSNIVLKLLTDYGYKSSDYFTLTCDAYGDWGPLPLPQCLPVSCGPPDMVDNANRMGAGFLYLQSMSYQCQTGYRVENSALGSTSFVRTCQQDGSWSPGTTCVDVDECEDTPGVCEDDHYCFNNAGGYNCVPMFPKSCDLQEGLALCQNGVCKMRGDKAECICDEGFVGTLCETPVRGLGVTLGIASLALAGVLTLLFAMFIIWCVLLRQAAPRITPSPVYGQWPPNGFRRPPMGRPPMGLPPIGKNFFA